MAKRSAGAALGAATIGVGAIAAMTLLAPAAAQTASGRPDDSPRAQAEERSGTDETPSWSYSGETGPDFWGSLNPDWALCADGSMQSPINVVDPTAKPLVNPVFRYAKSPATVVDNGHTVEGVPDYFRRPSFLRIGSAVYALKQFHFHAPSEHQINGKSYPLELHFVHSDESGQIAVVGLFVEEGAPAGPAWRPFLRALKGHDNKADDRQIRSLDWPALLPDDKRTIRYSGSLTTPGCSEGVRWNLLTKTMTMSRAEIARFTREYDDNHRPIQPLNGRTVQVDTTRDN